MGPSEPPPLQPSDSDPVLPGFSTITRAQRRERVMLAILAVLFSAAAAGTSWLLLHDNSRAAIVADAWKHLANAQNVQLNGSLTHHPPTDGAGIVFEASKQPQAMYMDATVTTEFGGELADTPVELFIADDRTTYLNMHGATFFDGLIRNANPAGALQLLRAEAMFSTQLQNVWLRLTSNDIAMLHEQSLIAQSAQRMPAQQCIAALLSGDGQVSQRLLTNIGSVLSNQTIVDVGEKNNNDTSDIHYRMALLPDELKHAWDTMPASPDIRQFNGCVRGQAGLHMPSLVADVWIDVENHQFKKVQLTLRTEDKHLATFESDMTYDTPEPKQLPVDVLSLQEVQAQTVANQPAVDAAFQHRLASFPSLNALVRELETLEAE